MAGSALSFVGGFAKGLTNAQTAEAEKRARDQDRFSALAMQSIIDWNKEIGTVRRQHQELNAMGKQLVSSGVEPEKIDYALSLPYQQAVKLMSDPEALRNIQVKPRQAAPTAAPAPAGPQYAEGMVTQRGQAPTMAPTPTGAEQPPAAPAGLGGPVATTPTAQPATAMPAAAPTATAQAQPPTYGMAAGTNDPTTYARMGVMELAKNAGWSPKMMAQFKQAMDSGADIGIYKFSNPETAGQLIFRDPKEAQRIIEGNKHAMNTMLDVAGKLDPTLPVQQRIKVLGDAYIQAYKGMVGSEQGAVIPSPEMFGQLQDPVYARQLLEDKRRKAELDAKIASIAGELERQGMRPEDAKIRAAGIAGGITQTPPREAPDPNPGFNQINRQLATQFNGEIITDPTTNTIRVKIVDPTLRAEYMLASSVAEQLYQTSLLSAGTRGTAMTPSVASNMGMEIVQASKTMVTNAMGAAKNNKEAANALLRKNIQEEQAKGDAADRNRLYALMGAVTLISLYTPEVQQAPAPPPAPAPRTGRATAPAPAQ